MGPLKREENNPRLPNHRQIPGELSHILSQRDPEVTLQTPAPKVLETSPSLITASETITGVFFFPPSHSLLQQSMINVFRTWSRPWNTAPEITTPPSPTPSVPLQRQWNRPPPEQKRGTKIETQPSISLRIPNTLHRSPQPPTSPRPAGKDAPPSHSLFNVKAYKILRTT